MLVSPLMSPILGFTFGYVIKDGEMTLVSLKSEILGLGLCIIFGFIFGWFYIPLVR